MSMTKAKNVRAGEFVYMLAAARKVLSSSRRGDRQVFVFEGLVQCDVPREQSVRRLGLSAATMAARRSR